LGAFTEQLSNSKFELYSLTFQGR